MSAVDAYLENQVLTATPQKLRLLLINGAIRFAHAALKHREEGRDIEAFEAIVRCRSIVTELFSVVRKDEFAAAGDVVAIYVFLFRELTEAQMHRDSDRLRGVIEVLEEERETWRLLCEQVPDAPVAATTHAPQEITMSSYQTSSQGPVRVDTPAPRPAFSLDA
jgi:flagellar protein FliS